MSQTNPTVADLLRRHAAACEFKQPINRPAIEAHLIAWMRDIAPGLQVAVRFVDDTHSAASAASAARATRDASAASAARATRDASAASAASAARAASAASAASAARATMDAWAARATGAAWDAMAAWATRAASAAWDASWVSMIAVGAAQRGDSPTFNRWVHLMDALESGLWLFWITDTEIICSVLPEIHTDHRNRPHCDTGPAFVWLRDVKDYYLDGVLVPEYVVMRPEEITVEKIEAERNAEVRRVMVTKYGQARYLIDSKAEEIHSDEWGTLYRKEVPGDEPLVMVKVVNSTAEPDGSFKDYFLRVNPELRPLFHDGTMGKTQEMTARNAVASTFGKRGPEYQPLIQT